MKYINIIFLLLISNVIIAMEDERKSLASFFCIDTFTQHKDISQNIAQHYLSDKQWWYVDKEIQFHGKHSGSDHPLLSRYPNYLKCVCFNSAGTNIIAFPSDEYNCIYIWDRDGKKLESLKGDILYKFYEKNKQLVDELYNSGNSPWSHNHEDDLKLLEEKFGIMTMLCVNEEQSFIVPQFRLYFGDSVHVWDQEKDKILLNFRHKGIINSVSFNPQGIEMITASADKTMRLWNKRTGQELLRVNYDTRVTSASFNSLGTEMVVATDDGKIQIFTQYHTENLSQILLKKLLHVWLLSTSPSNKIDSPDMLLDTVANMLWCDINEIKKIWESFPEYMRTAIWLSMYKKIQRYGKDKD